MSRPDEPIDDRPSATQRRWGRRLLAMVLGLGVVLAAEGVCRLAGWGDPTLHEDPFVGFSGTRPLFILNDDGSEYIIPRVREEYFARDSFSAEKGPQEKRIFCLGGSTVQGRPYSIATSFTQWLELALNVVDATHEWDVINCGGISYASYRLVPILEECLQYQPDLIILCTGHNEFLEDRTYQDVSRSALVHQASDVRLVNVARDWLDRNDEARDQQSQQQERTILPLETEPILNFNGGLAVYHRDEPWRRGVIDHYELNVRRMVQMARSAGVPIMLMQPASNLRDCPPFKSEHGAQLSTTERDEWELLLTKAREASGADDVAAVDRFSQLLKIDPDDPLTHYELGRSHLRLRDYDAARRSFVRARDLDICPLRMLSEMEQTVQRIADEEDVPFVNMHSLLEAQTVDGILGDDQLVDHIHPSIASHQHIADALVLSLAEQGFVTPSDDWKPTAHAAYATHLSTLESAYFIRGQRMLESLRLWAQGRADGPPATEKFGDRAGE